MIPTRVSRHGKASHCWPKFFFKFKPIGVNHCLNHEGMVNKVGQAKAEIGVVIIKTQKEEDYNLSYEAEERRRDCQRASAFFDSLVFVFFYAVNTFFPILCRLIHISFRLLDSPNFDHFYMVTIKGIMQGKVIAVAYTLRTYWNQFSLGGFCKQVLFSQEG